MIRINLLPNRFFIFNLFARYRHFSNIPNILDHKPSIFPDEPSKSIIDDTQLPSPPEITNELIDHLERLSLVRFSDEAAVNHLSIAVRYAQRLDGIDTQHVEPMITVLEDESLRLGSDESSAEDIADRKTILANAKRNVEDMFFVAPIGNVPLEERQDKLGHKEIKQLRNVK